MNIISQCNGLWPEKRLGKWKMLCVCFEAFWVAVALYVAHSLNNVMLFPLFIYFVQVFSTNCKTKRNVTGFFPCSFHRCCYCCCCCCRYCVVLLSHVSKILTCERQRHKNALRGLFVSFCEYCSAVLTLGNSFFWHSNICTQRKRVFDIFHWLLLFVSPLFRFSYLFFSQWLWSCATTTTVVLVFFRYDFFLSSDRYSFEWLFQCCHFMFYYR